MLADLLFDVTVVVSIMVAIGLLAFVGIDGIRAFRGFAVDQLRQVFPYLVLLGGVLLVNNYVREFGPGLSWIIGWNITGTIMALEGNLIGIIQGFAHPWLTIYFSYVYIYGYVFMLVFPIVVYLLHRKNRPIREVALAYALNYGIGVICYLLFIALGPRNTLVADGLLYTHWPESQLLTSEVNANVNVFPSLHASVSATVAILAYRWRDIYRWWFPVAVVGALSVSLSTMYLGIHWATDVAFGVVLAGFSVGAAIWMTRPVRLETRLGRIGVGLRRPLDRRLQFVLVQVLPNHDLEPSTPSARNTSRIETTIVSTILGFWTAVYALLGVAMLTGSYQTLTASEGVLSVPLIGGRGPPLGYFVLAFAVALAIALFGISHRRDWGWWGGMSLTVVHMLGALWVLLITQTTRFAAVVMAGLAVYAIMALWDEQGAFSVRVEVPELPRPQRPL